MPEIEKKIRKGVQPLMDRTPSVGQILVSLVVNKF